MTPRRLQPFVVACVLGVTVLAGCSSTSTVESTDTMPDLQTNPEVSTGITLDEETAEVVSESVVVDDDVDITQIVMIGDSITVGAMSYLEERFEALGYPEAIIEAQSGKRINVNAGDNRSGTHVASSIVEEMGWNGETDHADELWIVALGTNDVNQYSTSEELGEAIDSLLAEVPEESEIVWVDTAYVGSAEAADMVNETIADRTALRGDSSIAYWSAVAYRDGVLSGDGVHPTEVGSEVFAATVAAAAADAIIN